MDEKVFSIHSKCAMLDDFTLLFAVHISKVSIIDERGEGAKAFTALFDRANVKKYNYRRGWRRHHARSPQNSDRGTLENRPRSIARNGYSFI